jgi:hypothetical protein
LVDVSLALSPIRNLLIVHVYKANQRVLDWLYYVIHIGCNTFKEIYDFYRDRMCNGAAILALFPFLTRSSPYSALVSLQLPPILCLERKRRPSESELK